MGPWLLERPDVAVVDIGLPVMDGWELARRLRTYKAELHVITVTGMVDNEHRTRSLTAGFLDHLDKPLDIQMIHQVVQRLATRTSPE